LNDRLLKALASLKLGAMADALELQWRNPANDERSFEDRLDEILEAERMHRTCERTRRFTRQSGLPQSPDVSDIDYRPRRGLERAKVQRLAECDWVAGKQNTVITGPTGVGKTFLACALGVEAAKNDFSVAYWKTPALLDAFEVARGDGGLKELRGRLARADLLILDDWLIEPTTESHAHELRRLVDARHSRVATLVASPMPVDDWHSRLTDATSAEAILDRLLGTAHRIALKGHSFRMSMGASPP
jgi:DNA replication protein DnaC